jgi:hypothetical protein
VDELGSPIEMSCTSEAVPSDEVFGSTGSVMQTVAFGKLPKALWGNEAIVGAGDRPTEGVVGEDESTSSSKIESYSSESLIEEASE